MLVGCTLANAQTILQDDRTYSHAVKLTMLHETGVLTGEQYDNLNLYRRIRNDAVHDWRFSLAPDRIRDFKMPADISDITDIGMTLLLDLIREWYKRKGLYSD